MRTHEFKREDAELSKYFSRLFGNEGVKSRLGTAIKDSTLPHAFLISGPDGSGKTTLAKEIAAALNCEKRGGELLPCHVCNTCRRIYDDAFVDVKTLKRQKDKMTIGVEEVRLFREDMFLSATESDYKIYIIDEAQRLTPQAQNALLKVIEEPPENVIIFLLTSSDDAILTTIKSRTQHVSMQRFDVDMLAEYFTRAGGAEHIIDKNALGELLMCADGRIGRAKELLGGGADAVFAMREQTEAFISALKPSTPYSVLYTTIKSLPTKRDELTDSLESITVALRDLILLKFNKDAPLLFYPVREVALALAGGITSKRLIKIYDIITDSLDDLSKNVSTSALLTNLGARIKLI